MAVRLELTHGTNVAQMTTLAPRGFDYLPKAPTVDVRTVVDEYDGGELPAAFYRNVTEPVILYFNSLAQLRTAEETLQQFFDLAKFRQGNGAGLKVYLQFAESFVATPWRSEVLAGAPVGLDQNAFALTIAITRRFYWEQVSEILLSTSNDVTGLGNVITLYNHNSNAQGRNNYARIPASSVIGSVPAPARFQFTNTYASSTRSEDFYVGHMIEEATFSGQHVIEIESGTFYGGSARSNGAASGGQDGQLTWSGTAEAIGWSGTISAAALQAASGNWFKVMAYGSQAASDTTIRVRARVSIDQITMLWDGLFVPINAFANGLYDLGTVQLPPNLSQTGSLYPLMLELRCKSALAGTHNTYFDYIEFLPLRSFRLLKSLGYNTAQNVSLYDDPYDAQMYTGYGGGNIGNYSPLGLPIMLVPNKTNVIYLMCSTSDNVARSTQMRVWYRPRKLVP